MMNNYFLFLIVTIVLVLITGIVVAYFSYKNAKKGLKQGEYKKYTQGKLTNTDVSISKAVEHLRIVNSSKEQGGNGLYSIGI